MDVRDVGDRVQQNWFALSTKAGCECIPHTLQALCEMNPEATVTSVDGISAFDLVSRRAMLEGLHSVPGAKALPFVRMFYGQPSRHLWEDYGGTVHTTHQGGRRTPLLFGPARCIGGRPAPVACKREDVRVSGRYLHFDHSSKSGTRSHPVAFREDPGVEQRWDPAPSL